MKWPTAELNHLNETAMSTHPSPAHAPTESTVESRPAPTATRNLQRVSCWLWYVLYLSLEVTIFCLVCATAGNKALPQRMWIVIGGTVLPLCLLAVIAHQAQRRLQSGSGTVPKTLLLLSVMWMVGLTVLLLQGNSSFLTILGPTLMLLLHLAASVWLWLSAIGTDKRYLTHLVQWVSSLPRSTQPAELSPLLGAAVHVIFLGISVGLVQTTRHFIGLGVGARPDLGLIALLLVLSILSAVVSLYWWRDLIQLRSIVSFWCLGLTLVWLVLLLRWSLAVSSPDRTSIQMGILPWLALIAGVLSYPVLAHGALYTHEPEVSALPVQASEEVESPPELPVWSEEERERFFRARCQELREEVYQDLAQDLGFDPRTPPSDWTSQQIEELARQAEEMTANACAHSNIPYYPPSPDTPDV